MSVNMQMLLMCSGKFVTGVMIPQGTGTAIGNLTSNGGLAAVFDGNTNQSVSQGGRTASNTGTGYAGKNYSTPFIISKAIAYPVNDGGFDGTSTAWNTTLTLYGKHTAPSAYNDGTVIGTTGAFGDEASGYIPRTITSTDTVTAWEYVWVAFTTSGGALFATYAELQFYN